MSDGNQGDKTGGLGGANFGSINASVFSKNTQSMFVSVADIIVLGYTHLAWHTWLSPCLSEVLKVTYNERLWTLDGRFVTSKKPKRV